MSVTSTNESDTATAGYNNDSTKQPKYLGCRGDRLRILMLVLIVAPSFVLFGYNNGSTGGLLELESFVKQFPQMDVVNTTGAANAQAARIKGVVTGCYDLGAVFGSLSSIIYGNRIGRLRTVLIGLVFSIVGLAIESSAFSLAQFIVGRLVVGGAIGVISASVPVWQSECSTSSHRGTFVIFEGLCISAGISLSEWIDFGLSFSTKGSGQWRGPLVFPVLFALIVIPFVFCVPESPRWLMTKGRVSEARLTLSALLDVPSDSHTIEAELGNIQTSLERLNGDNGGGASLLRLLTNGEERLLHRTLLAMCGQMFQQMCGISALVFYTSTIFSELGFSSLESRVIGACLTSFQTCASIIPLFTIDRFGRRKLFMFSAVGLSLSMAVVAGTGSSASDEGQTNKAVAAVVFCFVYNFFFPIGFLGMTFLYATEIAPLSYRVPITAIANSTQWISQFIVAQVTPPGTSSLHNRYWIIYAVVNAFFAVIVYFFFPETTGRSLEDMDLVFESTTSIFDTVSVSKRLFNSRTVVDEKGGEHRVMALDKGQQEHEEFAV